MRAPMLDGVVARLIELGRLGDATARWLIVT